MQCPPPHNIEMEVAQPRVSCSSTGSSRIQQRQQQTISMGQFIIVCISVMLFVAPTLVHATPPQLLASGWNSAVLRLPASHSSSSSSVTAVRIETCFDQLLLLNGEPIAHHVQRVQSGEKNVHPALGLTRLRCGHSLLESHPPLAWNDINANKQQQTDTQQPLEEDDDNTASMPDVPLEQYPTYLFPYFPHIIPPLMSSNVSSLFAGGSAAPNCLWQLFLLPASGGSHADVGGCTLSFLQDSMQDWSPTTNLTNAQGEPFVGEVELPRRKDRKIHIFKSQEQAERLSNSKKKKSALPSSSYVFASTESTTLNGDSSASNIPLPATTSAVALANGALDKEATIFLQSWESFRNLEEVNTKQALELIIEPVTMLCIPLMVNLAVGIVGDGISDLIGGIIAPLLVDPISKPVIAKLLPAAPEDDPPSDPLELSDPETDGSAEAGEDAGDFLSGQGSDGAGYNTFLDAKSVITEEEVEQYSAFEAASHVSHAATESTDAAHSQAASHVQMAEHEARAEEALESNSESFVKRTLENEQANFQCAVEMRSLMEGGAFAYSLPTSSMLPSSDNLTDWSLVGLDGGVGGVAMRASKTRKNRPASFPSFADLFARFDMDGTYTITVEEWSNEATAILAYVSLTHNKHFAHLLASIDTETLAKQIVETYEFNGFPGTQLEEFMKDPDLFLHVIDELFIKKSRATIVEGKVVLPLFIMSKAEHAVIFDIVVRFPQLLTEQWNTFKKNKHITRPDWVRWGQTILSGANKFSVMHPLHMLQCFQRRLPKVVTNVMGKPSLRLTGLLKGGGFFRVETLWALVQTLGSCSTDHLLTRVWSMHKRVLELPTPRKHHKHSAVALDALAKMDSTFENKYRDLHRSLNWRMSKHGWRFEHLIFVFSTLDKNHDLTLTREELTEWLRDTATSVALKREENQKGPNSLSLPANIHKIMRSCLKYGAERLTILLFGHLDRDGVPGIQFNEFRVQPSLIPGSADVLNSGCNIETLTSDPAARKVQRDLVSSPDARSKRYMMPKLGIMPVNVLKALWREFNGGTAETVGVSIGVAQFERQLYVLERQAQGQFSDQTPDRKRRLHACFLRSIPWYSVQVSREADVDDSPGITFKEFQSSSVRVQGYVEALIRSCVDMVDREEKIDEDVRRAIKIIEPTTWNCKKLSQKQRDDAFTTNLQTKVREIALPEAGPLPTGIYKQSVDRANQLFAFFDENQSGTVTIDEMEVGFGRIMRAHQDAYCYANMRTLHAVVNCEFTKVAGVAKSVEEQFEQPRGLAKGITHSSFSAKPWLVDSMARKVIAECQTALTETAQRVEQLWNAYANGNTLPAPAGNAAAVAAAASKRITLPELVKLNAQLSIGSASQQLTLLQGKTRFHECVLSMLGGLSLEDYCLFLRTGEGTVPSLEGISKEQFMWQPLLPENSVRLGVKQCLKSTKETRADALSEFMAYVNAQHSLTPDAVDLSKAPAQTGSTAEDASDWYYKIPITAEAVGIVLRRHIDTLAEKSTVPGYYEIAQCIKKKVTPPNVQVNVLDVWIRRAFQLQFVRSHLGTSENTDDNSEKIKNFLYEKQHALLTREPCPAEGRWPTLNLFTDVLSMDHTLLYNFPGLSPDVVNSLPVGTPVTYEQIYSDIAAGMRWVATLTGDCTNELAASLQLLTKNFVRYDLNKDDIITYPELVAVWNADLDIIENKDDTVGSNVIHAWTRGLIPGMAHKVLTELAGYPKTDVYRKVYDKTPNAIPDTFETMQQMSRRATEAQVKAARATWAELAGSNPEITAAAIQEHVAKYAKHLVATKFGTTTQKKLQGMLDMEVEALPTVADEILKHWANGRSSVTTLDFNAEPHLLHQRVWEHMERWLVGKDVREKIHTALFKVLDADSDSVVNYVDLASFYRTKKVEVFKENQYAFLSKCIDAQLETSAVTLTLHSIVGGTAALKPKFAKFSYTELSRYSERVKLGWSRIVEGCRISIGSNVPALTSSSSVAMPAKPSALRAKAVTELVLKPLFPFLTPTDYHAIELVWMESPIHIGLSGHFFDRQGDKQDAPASKYPNPSLNHAIQGFHALVRAEKDASLVVNYIYSTYDVDHTKELSAKEFETYYLSLMGMLSHQQLIIQWVCLIPHATALSTSIITQIKSLGRRPPHALAESLSIGIDLKYFHKSPTVMHEAFGKVMLSCGKNKEMYAAFNFYDRNLDLSATIEELYFIYETLWLSKAEQQWLATHQASSEDHVHALNIFPRIGKCIRKGIMPTLRKSFKDMEFNGKKHIQVDEFALQPTRWFDDAVALQKHCEQVETARYWNELFWVFDLNKDGTITKEEATYYLQGQIHAIDTKGDTPDKKELRRVTSCLARVLKQAVNDLFDRFDTNGREGIQLDEFQLNPKMLLHTMNRMRKSCDAHVEHSTLVTQFWKDWDTNHDGTIDRREMENALRWSLREAAALTKVDPQQLQKCVNKNMESLLNQIFAILETNGIEGLQPEELDSEDQLAVVHRAGKAAIAVCTPSATSLAPSPLKLNKVASTHDLWLGIESPLLKWEYCSPSIRRHLSPEQAVSAPVSLEEFDTFFQNYFKKADESFIRNSKANKWSAHEQSTVVSGHALYSQCVSTNLPLLSKTLYSLSNSGTCKLLHGETLYSYGLALGQRCRRIVWEALSDLKLQQKGEKELEARAKEFNFDAPAGEWWHTHCQKLSKSSECNRLGVTQLLIKLFQFTTVQPTNIYRTKFGPWLNMLPWTPSWLSTCVEEKIPALATAILKYNNGGVQRVTLTLENFNDAALNLPSVFLLGFGGVNLGCHRFFMAARGNSPLPTDLDVQVTHYDSLVQLFTLCSNNCPTDQKSMLEVADESVRLPDSTLRLDHEADDINKDESMLEGGSSAQQELHQLHFASPFSSSSSELEYLAGTQSGFHLSSAASKHSSSPFFPALMGQEEASFGDIDTELDAIESQVAHPVALELNSVFRDMHGSRFGEGDERSEEELLAMVETNVFVEHSSMHRALGRVHNKLMTHNPHIPEQPEKGYTLPGSPDGGALVNKIANSLSDSQALHLTIALRVALEDNIMMQVNRTTSRQLSRQLTKRMTIAMTESITRKLLGTLTRPIVESTTRLLLHSLTPSLTFSLSAAISPSITRTPHEDYYNWFCQNNQQYCAYDKASRTNVYYADFYRNRYAFYYSHYYGVWYSQSGANDFLNQPLEEEDEGGDE